MENISELILYTLKNCEKSARLKTMLNRHNIKFVEKNQNTNEVKIELKKVHRSFIVGPVIRYMDTTYEYYQIFEDDGSINEEIISTISNKNKKTQ